MDLALLESLAASAAIAIDNARLYEETQRLREFNENIVQSMEEGILLENERGQITFGNRRAAELLGYSPKELAGQHWAALVESGHRLQVQRERARWSPGTVSRYETVLLARDGLPVPVLVSARPLFDDRRFTGALVVFTDISERMEAEEALRRQNKQLTTLNAIATTIGQLLDLEHILNATLDKVLEMMRMNAGWIQLIDRNADGDFLSLIAHRGISEETLTDLSAVRVGRGLMGRVIRLGKRVVVTAASGSSWIDVQSLGPEASWTLVAIPIQARDTVLGALSVLSRKPRELTSHDMQTLTAIGHQIGMAVENLRLLEEASEMQLLRELDRLRSELVANVSHELRTPLGLIKIFCTTLMREDVKLDRETQLEFLCDIEAETDKLTGIVSNLLDLSRVDSGRLRLEEHATDIGQLVKGVMQEMESQLTRQRLVHDLPSGPLVGSVDSSRIAQVLRNLLSNAIKYSPAGGTITVRGYGDKEQIVVQVRDQGIGISGEDLDRVFERFYRVENETTRSVRGVGLGLAVCQGIVEAHGGRIWVESTLGVGSVFYFSLPVGAVSES